MIYKTRLPNNTLYNINCKSNLKAINSLTLYVPCSDKFLETIASLKLKLVSLEVVSKSLCTNVVANPKTVQIL